VNGVADGPVLVTGGAGFLGRHLVDQLIGVEGREVRVIDPQPWAPPPGGAAIAGSILDPEALDRAMRGVAELHHLAAHAHLFARDSGVYERVNVEGTRAVLEAAKRHAVKRIVVVSSAVILRGWNDPDPSPVTEAGPIPPRSAMAGPYSRSKREADGLVRRAVAEGLPAVTLYPTVPLGPGDHGMTAPTRMLAMLLERPPPAYLECRLDLVPVTDLAALCRLAARRIANSLLVKTAVFGGDPNWGRILQTAGAGRVRVNLERAEVRVGGAVVFRNGHPTGPATRRRAARGLRRSEVEIALHLAAGRATAHMWTCDLSYDYVRINAEYTT